MELWRCGTCANLASLPLPCCPVCSGDLEKIEKAPIPSGRIHRDLELAFQQQAGIVSLLRLLAKQAARENRPESAALLAEISEREEKQVEGLCLLAGTLPDFRGGLEQAIQILIKAKVELYPRFADAIEGEGCPSIAAHLKWLAFEKAESLKQLAALQQSLS